MKQRLVRTVHVKLAASCRVTTMKCWWTAVMRLKVTTRWKLKSLRRSSRSHVAQDRKARKARSPRPCKRALRPLLPPRAQCPCHRQALPRQPLHLHQLLLFRASFPYEISASCCCPTLLLPRFAPSDSAGTVSDRKLTFDTCHSKPY